MVVLFGQKGGDMTRKNDPHTDLVFDRRRLESYDAGSVIDDLRDAQKAGWTVICLEHDEYAIDITGYRPMTRAELDAAEKKRRKTAEVKKAKRQEQIEQDKRLLVRLISKYGQPQ